MVVAGPGTGKTQILTVRIANILKKTDTPPDAILALTFTESGVAAMRRRLVEITGSAGYKINIHTFHGFCNEIIRRYPDEFPRIIGAKPISEVVRIELFRLLLDTLPLALLRPFGDPYYHVSSLRRVIGELKRENISPEKLHSHVSRAMSELEDTPDLYHEKGVHKGSMKGKVTWV